MEVQPRRTSSPHGNTFLSWEVDEYPRYKRSALWYAVAGLVTVGFLWYALATANFLFALIVLIFAIVSVLFVARDPRRIPVAVTEDGVEIGAHFHPWKDFRAFWVVYNPPVIKTLYLDFSATFRAPVGIPLEDIDPNAIRSGILAYLGEDTDKQDEPFTDTLSRLFKV